MRFVESRLEWREWINEKTETSSKFEIYENYARDGADEGSVGTLTDFRV